MSIVENPSPIVSSTPENAAHFFGFHDVCPWDSEDKRVLLHRVPFEYECKMPTGQEIAELCVWYPEEERIVPFAETTAWNWQQGSRLQWLPGEKNTVIYNEMKDGTLQGIIHELETGHKKCLPYAIYSIRPDGCSALVYNYARLHKYWPAYGYAGANNSPDLDTNIPDKDGLFAIDLQSGDIKLLLSINNIIESMQLSVPKNLPLFISHPTYSPGGLHFCFYVRTILKDGGLFSYFIKAKNDGSELSLIAREKVSHFDWYDEDTMVVWTRKTPKALSGIRSMGLLSLPVFKQLFNILRRFRPKRSGGLISDHYYLIDHNDSWRSLGNGELNTDGHPMFSKDRRWMLTDTYPLGDERKQALILYDMSTNQRNNLHYFISPDKYGNGDWKCDLHPRWNRTENMICVDSTFSGTRQVYLLDVSKVVSD